MRKIILVLLFVVSVFAGDDEIGVPVIDWKKAQIESAVLASDGKSFYTLQGKDLIQWNLSPLKKLNEWQVPLKEITTGEKYQRFHDIWFLDNYTKVLITSIEGMMIYDLKTHKVDKEVEYTSHSLVRDGDFIYLTHPSLIRVFEYNIELEMWSIPELKRVKSINITEMGRKHISTCCGPEAINSVEPCETDCPIMHLNNFVIGKNVIYYPTEHWKVLLLNKSNLGFKDVRKSIGSSWFEILEGGYLNTGFEIYRLSDDKLIFHSERDTTAKFIEENSLQRVRELRASGRHSTARTLGLQKKAHYLLFRLNKGKKFFARLVQYKGDLIIQGSKSLCADYKKGNGCFESTSHNSPILQMKTKEGKVLPMNDATYNKYFKRLNLGD